MVNSKYGNSGDILAKKQDLSNDLGKTKPQAVISDNYQCMRKGRDFYTFYDIYYLAVDCLPSQLDPTAGNEFA